MEKYPFAIKVIGSKKITQVEIIPTGGGSQRSKFCMQARSEYHNKWVAIIVHTLRNPISCYCCLFYNTSNNISYGGSDSTGRSDIVRGDNSGTCSGAGRGNRIDGGFGIVCTCSGTGRGYSSSGIGSGTSRGGGDRSSHDSGVGWRGH